MELIRLNQKITTPISLFFLSASIVLYEILLTRIFSVVFNYHYSFTILSLVMFGFGIGGLLLGRSIRRKTSLQRSMIIYIITAVGAVTVSAIIGAVTETIPRPVGVLLFVVLGVAPFIASGFAVSSFFSRWPGLSSLIYAGDMAGAALGALVSILVLDTMGPIKGTLVVGIFAGLSVLILTFSEKTIRIHRRLIILAISVLAIHFFVAFFLGSDVPITKDVSKDLIYAQSGDSDWEILERRWSSFGRTDLIQVEGGNEAMGLYVDGAAGTAMFDSQKLLIPQNQFYSFSGLIPLKYLNENQKDSALVIGAGAGRDVIANLLAGVQNVTAVEVNPDIVDIVKEYEEYNGGLYTRQSRVTVVVGEGRRFVRESSEQYDIIMLTLPITKSSRSIEGYALTENSLFTVEAFSDYLSKLTDEGQLIVVAHHEPEVMRLISLALEAYRQEGIEPKDVMERLYTIGSPMMPIVVFTKDRLTMEEASVRYFDQISMGFLPGSFYIPYLAEGLLPAGSASAQLQKLENGTLEIQSYISSATYNLFPVTDDSPFFYNFSRNILDAFPKLLWLFLLSIPVIMFFVIRKGRATTLEKGSFSAYIGLFALLGVAYMIVEISIFQKLMFIFENPARAASMLLFTLLIGSGIGGFISGLEPFKKQQALPKALAIVTVIIPVASIILDRLIYISKAPDWTAGIIVMIIGITMGIPFPIAIREAGQSKIKNKIPLLWAANGMFSVVGAISSMVLGMTIGFKIALYIGSFLYLTAILVTLFLSSQKQPKTDKRGFLIGMAKDSA